MRRSAGFSLLEVLIALFILSVGAASVLALFAAGASTHKRSVDRTNAAILAERVFSEARAAYEEGDDPAEVLEKLKKRLPEEIDGYHQELSLHHPEVPGWGDSELYARVTIRWRQSDGDRTQEFHTILLPRFMAGEGG